MPFIFRSASNGSIEFELTSSCVRAQMGLRLVSNGAFYLRMLARSIVDRIIAIVVKLKLLEIKKVLINVTARRPFNVLYPSIGTHHEVV